MNSILNSKFPINSYMNSDMNSLPGHFLVHFFMNSCQISWILILYSELIFICNNHAIQSILLFLLTIFLSTGDFSSSKLSSFCFLTSDLHLACVFVGIMLQATARWEAFFSQSSPVNLHVIIWAELLLCIVLLSSAESLLKV